MRISISQRVGVGLLLVLGLVVILLVVNSAAVSAYRSNTLVLANETLPQTRTLGALRSHLDEAFAESLRYLIGGDDLHLFKEANAIAQVRADLTALQELQAHDQVGAKEEGERLADLSDAVGAAIRLTGSLTDRRQAGEQLSVAQVSGELDQSSAQVYQAIDTFQQALDAESEDTVAEAQSNPLIITSMIGVLVLLVCVGLFVLLLRTVVRPIHTLRGATLAVAGGDLRQQVPALGRDELGDLAQAFNTMVARLADQQQLLQDQVNVSNRAREDAERARQEIADQLALIDEQRAVIREMSVPILPLSANTLVMPLVGALDSTRLRMAQEQALHALERSAARHLILDVTGVPVVDTQVAQGLIQVVQAARLLGAEAVLVGIRPEVAQALVGLGVNLAEMTTRSDLQSGISYALAQRGVRGA